MEEKQLGERIKNLRERKAWTQEHLAAAANISARTVQRAEDGALSPETLSAIAGALDVAIEDISSPKRAPSGWSRITPSVFYDDPNAAVDWLANAFGFHVRLRVPGSNGKLMHSELEFEDAVIMVGPTYERWKSPKSIAGVMTQGLYVFVNDVDAHYKRAREAGAKIIAELEEYHGHRRYRVEDLEGHEWGFAEAVHP